MRRFFALLLSVFLCIFLSCFVGGGQSFFGENVYAQGGGAGGNTTDGGSAGGNTTDGSSTTDKNDDASKTQLSIAIWLETILRVIYLIMWPLLALAGAAMDNSLVYGEIFNFTPALWKFWTIMRNFANFSLGFLFLRAIFKTLFTNGPISGLFDSLKKLVLGAILVQASRFIMASLIDLSTVATISIGGLPLYAVKDDVDYKKIRFLKPYGIFQMDKTTNELATEAEHTVFYSCADDPSEKPFFIPCSIDAGYLAYNGKKADPESWESWKQQFVDSWGTTPVTQNGTSLMLKDHISDQFCVYRNALIKNDFGAELLTEAKLAEYRKEGVSYMTDNERCLSLATIIQKTKGLSGPLFTLYASLLNTSELALSTNHKNLADLSLEFLMRVVMAILLCIPLLVFAIIMVMRVGYLWLIIATSPILVLLFINKGKVPGGNKTVEEVANLSNILNLIFLPVIGTFAISLSIVFLSLIQRADFMREVSLAELFDLAPSSSKDITNDKGELLTRKCYHLKLTQLCFNESQQNAGNNIGDTFGYLLINGFGLALMWTVVFAALKSSKITGGVVTAVKGFGETALGAIPFIPTGSGMLSYRGAQQVGKGIKDIPQRISSQQNTVVEDILNKEKSSSNISEIQKNLNNGAKSEQDAKAIIKTPGIESTGTNHSDYKNFFETLHKGSGASGSVPENFTQAFSNPTTYASYNGMDGMKDILSKRNGSTNIKKRQEYFDKYGKEMVAGLDAQANQSGSTVKRITPKGGGDPYYFDVNAGKVARYDKEVGMSVESFAKEKAGGLFEKKIEVEEFINRSLLFGGVQPLEPIYPKTIEQLNSKVGSTLQLGVENETTVTVTGSAGKAESIK